MNVKTLNEMPERLDECVTLIEGAFNYDDQYSFKEDFSLLLQKENYANCFFLLENDQVVATLFTLPRVLQYKDAEIPVLFLGGISVRDDKRGGGLFKTLLETILLLNGDYAFYLLWSDLSQLYEKFSFYEFGLIEEVDLREKANNLKESENADKEHFIGSYQNLKNNYLIPKRSDQDWNNLLSNSKTIKILEDSENNFYFVNKGMDLQGICHEHHPIDAKPLEGFINWRLTDKPESQNNLRYMGFMRLGNLEHVNNLIQFTSQGRLALDSYEAGMIKVIFDGEIYELGEKDFIQGLWGPGRVEEWTDLMPHILIHGYDSI